MIYRFDIYSLDTEEFSFTRDSEPISLEPRVFDVLVYLIENSDRIVSKDELVESLWDCRIITDSALNTCIRSIRRALSDDRHKQKFIRTFPKRGFQFVGNIKPTAPDSTEIEFDSSSTGSKPVIRKPVLIFSAILVLFIISLSAFFVFRSLETDGTTYQSDKLTIAVLDFDHTFKSETQRYFTEGFVEELVSSLSLYRELFVIARNSSALYDNNEASIKEIGNALGAKYIVDGSVRYDVEDIQISTRLVDASSGQQVWSAQFNRDQREIYSLQNELAYLIAGQIFPELVRINTEKNSKKPPEVLDAWALYHKARTKQAVYRKEMQEEAIRWATLALVRDPNLAAAHGVIARAKGTQFFYQWTDDPQQTLEEATASAKMAISLDKNDPGAYAALGYIYRYTGDETSSIANLKRATFLNPSDANIKLEYAHTLDWFRHQDLALPEINQAIKLSPRDPRLENMLFYKAHIQFHLLKFEDSLATSEEMSGVLTTDTWRVFYHLIRAANLAQLDREQDAQQSVLTALKINPKLTLTAMRKRFEGSKNHPENRRFWLESLAMAGVPK